MKIDEIRNDLEAIAADRGCDLFDVTFDGQALRIVLDRVDSVVTLDDCTMVSRQVSALLDVSDFGNKKYTLEVSSPGLDRPLRGADDFRRFVGHLARVTYTRTSTGSDAEAAATGTVVGRIESLDESDDGGIVVLSEPSREQRHEIPLTHVKRAQLEIEL